MLALRISGGLLPCPSALVLMLASIGAEKIAYGLLLTTVFSLGLATTRWESVWHFFISENF